MTKKTDDDSEEPPSSLRALARRLDDLELPRGLVSAIGNSGSTLRRWATTTPKSGVRRERGAAGMLSRRSADVRALRGLVGPRPSAGAPRALEASGERREARHRHGDGARAARRVGSRRGNRSRCAPWLRRDGPRSRSHSTLRARRRRRVRALPHAHRGQSTRTTKKPLRAFSTPISASTALSLVVRMDRAKAHRAPRVTALLDAHKVLVLHGPPRYPRFYGQLERQNREHAGVGPRPRGPHARALRERTCGRCSAR